MSSESESTEDLSLDLDGSPQDQAKALLLLKHTLKENRQLTANFDSLKAIHLRLASSHEQLQLQVQQLQQERQVAIEQQYQQLCESWRAELQEKQGQFEAARDQILQPRDLDLLRVQLLEEVEAPLQAKCQAIAQEAEVAQQQFVQLRRTHEALQNTIKSQEMQALQQQQEHCALQQTLSEKLQALEAVQGQVHQLELQLRQVQQQREAAALQLRCSQEEAAELRRAKEDAFVEKEQLVVKMQRHRQQQQAEASQLQALVESLTRKNRHLTDELAEAVHAQEATHDQLMQLRAQHTALSSQLAGAQASAEREKQLLIGRAEAAEQQHQERVQELLGQLLQKERQIAQLTLAEQQALQLAESRASEQQAAATKAMAAMEQVASMSSKLEVAQAAAAELQTQLRHAQDKADQEVASARAEAEQADAQLSDMQEQLRKLQQQLAEQQQLVDALGQHAAAAAAAAGGVTDSGLQQHPPSASTPEDLPAVIKTEARCLVLEQQVKQVQAQLSQASSQLSELQGQQELLQGEHEKQLSSLVQAAATEKERHASKMRKLQEEAKAQIRVLRNKLKDSRASNEQLNWELNRLRSIALHGLHQEDEQKGPEELWGHPDPHSRERGSGGVAYSSR